MTSFDELIGAEPTGADRQRLRGVHDLLVEAGAPPELTPEMESGPKIKMLLGRERQPARTRRRGKLLPLIAAAVLIAVVFGMIHGLGNGGNEEIVLRGTAFAPQASARLEILGEKSGKQPMRITVTGLPTSGRAPYIVYLVRHGQVIAPCGTFAVTNSTRSSTHTLYSPYRLHGGDDWIVKGKIGLRYVTVLRRDL